MALVCFGVMDELAHHYYSIRIPFIKKNPQFWNKDISWKNKWKTTIITVPTTKQKALIVLYGWENKKEKFWGSSRWFVFITDGWHLMQFISYQLLALVVALAYTDQMWVAILLSLPVHIAMSTIKAATMKMV